MGCVVNGPGEAKEADIGIAGGKGVGVLFKKGKVVRKLKEKEFVSVLLREIYEMASHAPLGKNPKSEYRNSKQIQNFK
jgi:(E)-4-hydroxy-3-methylbut-2-enyl-diphosphate synthase